ncbi:MAG: PorP/SprF family type IX secretion system membrane protein [Bacteroidia bacterium]|nr:PorP/SprF family type IX secretion system membrane protein [Bacteroidia bacterium]
MKNFIGGLLLSVCFLNSHAQLTPNTQLFLFNPVLVNPAIAGMHSGQAQIGYDARWVGLNGAPNTGFLRYDKMFNGNTGWDIAIISDRIGPVSSISLVNSFSFHLQTSLGSHLSFGIKHHLTKSYLNINSSLINNPDDPLLAQDQTSLAVNNFDAGLAFYHPNTFMIGFSVMNLIPQPRFRFTNSTEQPVLNLHAWYATDFSEDIGIEAFALLTSTSNTPLNINIGCMGVYQHKFGAGFNFSPANQLGIFAYVKATEKLSVFYNYNLPLSSIFKVSKQSHSIGIAFRIGKDSPVGTRFFMQPTEGTGRNRMF